MLGSREAAWDLANHPVSSHPREQNSSKFMLDVQLHGIFRTTGGEHWKLLSQIRSEPGTTKCVIITFWGELIFRMPRVTILV